MRRGLSFLTVVLSLALLASVLAGCAGTESVSDITRQLTNATDRSSEQTATSAWPDEMIIGEWVSGDETVRFYKDGSGEWARPDSRTGFSWTMESRFDRPLVKLVDFEGNSTDDIFVEIDGGQMAIWDAYYGNPGDAEGQMFERAGD
jgi:hypothetical protein